MLKFMVKTGLTPIQSWRQLQAVFGKQTMCKMQVREWHKRFKSGHQDTADAPRSGRPRTSRTPENIQKVRELLQDNPRMSLHEMCSATGLSMTVVLRIVKKDLCMKQRCAKFVPRILTERHRKKTGWQQLKKTLICFVNKMIQNSSCRGSSQGTNRGFLPLNWRASRAQKCGRARMPKDLRKPFQTAPNQRQWSQFSLTQEA